MAVIVNRKYGSRLECLHTILKQIELNSKSYNFTFNDLKYDSEKKYTVMDCCPLLKENLGRHYCPYLENPLDDSKCYATQSINSDTTKSKAISDVGRSLEALGFIEELESSGNFKITDFGKKFIDTDYLSVEMSSIIEKAVLSYSPVLGFLFSASLNSKEGYFKPSDIYIGYPITEEPSIDIKLGSTQDSVSRTRSKIVSWCLSAGFVETKEPNLNNSPPHIFYREELNKDILRVQKLKLTSKAENILSSFPYIRNPLFYERLNKNVGSKRERNQKKQRRSEMSINPKLLTRRYYLVKILNHAGKHKKQISFENLTKMFKESPLLNNLFSDQNIISDTLATDIYIGFLAGVPFLVTDHDQLEPISTINEDTLEKSASQDEIDLINSYLKEDKYDIFISKI